MVNKVDDLFDGLAGGLQEIADAIQANRRHWIFEKLVGWSLFPKSFRYSTFNRDSQDIADMKLSMKEYIEAKQTGAELIYDNHNFQSDDHAAIALLDCGVSGRDLTDGIVDPFNEVSHKIDNVLINLGRFAYF